MHVWLGRTEVTDHSKDQTQPAVQSSPSGSVAPATQQAPSPAAHVKQLRAKRARNSSPQAQQVLAIPETIHELLAEVRITGALMNPSLMPHDVHIIADSEESYLQGAVGRTYLQSQSASYRRVEAEGAAISIQHFIPLPNSDLIGRPISALANYSLLHIVDRSVSGRFFECSFIEVTLRVNGIDVLRWSDPLSKRITGPQELPFDIPLTGMKLPPSRLPTENAKPSESIAWEVVPLIPYVPFSFMTTGDKEQKITSSVLPRDIRLELEPNPVVVLGAKLSKPQEVTYSKGTIKVLEFGQEGDKGYMVFDTQGVPTGTTIRGYIIKYDRLPPKHPS